MIPHNHKGIFMSISQMQVFNKYFMPAIIETLGVKIQ